MSYVISESNITIKDKVYESGIGAYMMHPDGKPYHTFRTATVLVDGNNIKFENCRFVNNAGEGSVVGQAIAMYVDGDDISFEDCVFEGNQDTLFLAPLPPKEYEKDGFLGPKQFTERTPRIVRFKNCIIKGSIDFVFGGATAYFEDCEFISVGEGYVFAPCTPEDISTGFVARNCKFTYEGNIKPGSCYIARPWREYAKVELIDCYLDKHIHKAGWHDWNKENVHATISFIERNSSGPGWSKSDRPDYIQFD